MRRLRLGRQDVLIYPIRHHLLGASEGPRSRMTIQTSVSSAQ